MAQVDAAETRPSRGRTAQAGQWSALVLLSAGIGIALELVGLPAALLLGPMVAAIAASVAGIRVAVPRSAYAGAQALVGCLIASTFRPATMETIGRNWPVFLAVVVATYAASLLQGYAMSRWKILPGSTAVWGSAPGAASVMMMMAEAFGADPRLVAFMQYLRVVFVALAASLVARFWAGAHPGGQAGAFAMLSAVRLVPEHWLAFLETLAVAVGGGAFGRWSRLPAGQLLAPMVIGGILRASGFLTLELPSWLLALSYAVVGWKIGLGFTRDVLARTARATLPILANVVILILVCAALGLVLVKGFGVDPLTAYLATSPGGMDSVAIIGASTKADLPFVMALHAMRFIIVLTLGPAMARVVARWAERD